MVIFQQSNDVDESFRFIVHDNLCRNNTKYTLIKTFNDPVCLTLPINYVNLQKFEFLIGRNHEKNTFVTKQISCKL